MFHIKIEAGLLYNKCIYNTASANIMYTHTKKRKTCRTISILNLFRHHEIDYFWPLQLQEVLKVVATGFQTVLCTANYCLSNVGQTVQWDCCTFMLNFSSKGHQCSQFPAIDNILYPISGWEFARTLARKKRCCRVPCTFSWFNTCRLLPMEDPKGCCVSHL